MAASQHPKSGLYLLFQGLYSSDGIWQSLLRLPETVSTRTQPRILFPVTIGELNDPLPTMQLLLYKWLGNMIRPHVKHWDLGIGEKPAAYPTLILTRIETPTAISFHPFDDNVLHTPHPTDSEQARKTACDIARHKKPMGRF